MATVELGVNGQQVTRLCFDHAVTLLTDGLVEMRIETRLPIHAPNDVAPPIIVSPDEPEVGRLLMVLHRPVTDSRAGGSGD